MDRSWYHDSEDKTRAALLGRTVTKVADDKLQLDDGTVLIIQGNCGCGGCSAGNYALTELNDCPVNAIMAVDFETVEVGERTDSTWDSEDRYSYRVFVLAQDERIKLWQVDGDDGNGYYGTGYWIQVEGP